MADERDEEREEPRIKIVDRRLNFGMDAPVSKDDPEESAPPKLEIVGGAQASAPTQSEPESSTDDGYDLGDEPELSDEEAAQLQEQFESEQFAQLEAQIGRPLTESEKGQVRQEMERQAQQAAALEVAPLILNTMAELSARAAIHLGLMPNPYTRLIARNDTQARIAIDAFGALYDIVKLQLPETAAREYARVLNDLRVNFASITGQQAGGPSRIIH